MTTTASYSVRGMSCDHCVAAVTAELSKLDGVVRVDVDLAGGTATVESETPLDRAAVAAAIDDAGYELVA